MDTQEHPDIQVARDLLTFHQGRWAAICEAAGVSHSWLSQFHRGAIPNPGINTVARVIAACREVG